MTAQHTPTPWTLCRTLAGTETIQFHLAGDKAGSLNPIVQCLNMGPLEHRFSNAEIEANAAFIVKACNAHDALVEALQDILTYRGGAANALEDEYVMGRAHEALKLAGAS